MLCAVVMTNNSDGVLLPIAASAGKTRCTLFVSSLSSTMVKHIKQPMTS